MTFTQAVRHHMPCVIALCFLPAITSEHTLALTLARHDSIQGESKTDSSQRPKCDYLALPENLCAKFCTLAYRDVTEPANIRIRRMRISCAKSVGCGFVARSRLPAIIATVIELSYFKLSSCKRTSSEQLK